MREKLYKFLGMILKDGDTFEVQVEKPNENKYNPSGIAIYEFNHKNYTGWEEIPYEDFFKPNIDGEFKDCGMFLDGKDLIDKYKNVKRFYN